MIEGYTVGVVIPCYNEEQGLEVLLPRCPREVDEVIVVNNNSTDRTDEVARRHGARVVFEKLPGYGRAYQAGFAAAQSDILVTLDGDGQYPIQDVPRLVRILLERNLDFLSGCRFPLERSSMPLMRHVGNILLTTAARMLFGVHMRDTQSGMWIFHRSLLDVVHPVEPGMPLSQEFKLKVVLAGFRFGEEHIVYAQRAGVSTLNPLKDGWENLSHLFRLRAEAGFFRGTAKRPRVLAQAQPARTLSQSDKSSRG